MWKTPQDISMGFLKKKKDSNNPGHKHKILKVELKKIKRFLRD